jgi:signal transduction histidine kinase
MKRPTPIWAGAVEEVVNGHRVNGHKEEGLRLLERNEWPRIRRFGQHGAPPPSDDGKRSTSKLQRDIHDTVLQDVLCLAMGLNGLSHLYLNEVTKNEVEHLRELAAGTYDRLRELISRDDVEPVEAPRSMRDVLVDCVHSFNQKSGANVEVQVNSQDESLLVSGEAARQTELIIHEALCNAWRHGGGSTIRAVLSETADIVWVRIMDDGPGFDPWRSKAGHYGLRIMRERAEAIGARFGISSAPGKGTCVNLYLPSHHPVAQFTQEVAHGHSFAGRR